VRVSLSIRFYTIVLLYSHFSLSFLEQKNREADALMNMYIGMYYLNTTRFHVRTHSCESHSEGWSLTRSKYLACK